MWDYTAALTPLIWAAIRLFSNNCISHPKKEQCLSAPIPLVYCSNRWSRVVTKILYVLPQELTRSNYGIYEWSTHLQPVSSPLQIQQPANRKPHVLFGHALSFGRPKTEQPILHMKAYDTVLLSIYGTGTCTLCKTVNSSWTVNDKLYFFNKILYSKREYSNTCELRHN